MTLLKVGIVIFTTGLRSQLLAGSSFSALSIVHPAGPFGAIPA